MKNHPLKGTKQWEEMAHQKVKNPTLVNLCKTSVALQHAAGCVWTAALDTVNQAFRHLTSNTQGPLAIGEQFVIGTVM